MTAIKDIPAAVLSKIEECAFLRYKVSSTLELKAAIVDEQFEIIVNDYLAEATMRIMRKKADEAKICVPTEEEIVGYLQKTINVVDTKG